MGVGASCPPPWRRHLLCSAFLFLFICLWGTSDANEELAALPPRGWNSYDSFSWIVDENAYMQNAQILAEKLLPHGYQYAVIDFLWYRKYVDGAYTDSYGFDNIDEWGRPFPDLQRFPSSINDRGFSQIASKVHEMGLKFGIHLMKGISLQSVNANTPILDTKTGKPYIEDGRHWTARDIGLNHRTCAWMPHGFMSVNTDIGAGRAFLRSLYQQYANWGVDFVKVDCIFGTDYSPEEIIIISELLQEIDRPIILSLSPGTEVTPALAENISNHVNMYRITGDDWDNWKDVSSHFSVSSSFAAAKKIGAIGLRGKSWPDLDMLPFGWLTDPSVNQGPHRKSNLTLDEQKTQVFTKISHFAWGKQSLFRHRISLPWATRNIKQSSILQFQTLMILVWMLLLADGALPQRTSFPCSPDAGGMQNSYSRLCATVESRKEGTTGARAWVATGSKGEIYLAFFNLDSTSRKMTVRISDLKKVLRRTFVRKNLCSCTEVWSGRYLGLLKEEVSGVVNPHGSMVFEIIC